MNIKEVFEKFPISKAGIAEGVGENKVWLAQRLSGYRKWKKGDLEKIQKYLNSMGKELSKLKLK